MRIQTGWGLVLLTLAWAWMPTASWGQVNYAPPDPVMPLPLFKDRPETGGLYTYGDFVFYRMSNPLQHQVVATRGILDFDGTITADLSGTRIFPTDGSPSFIVPGPRRPGLFLGSNTPALFADDAKNPQTFQPGFKIGFGWKFQNDWAVSIDWLHLTQAQYSAVATLVPPTLNPGTINTETFLFSPVFNFPNEFAGAAQKVALGAPFAAYGIWNGASVEGITFFQRYDEINLTARVPVYEDDCNRCYGLIGARMNWLWERFRWRVVSQDFTGNSDQTDVATYSNITSQRMYGVHLGGGIDRRIGDTPIGTFSVSLDLDAALLIDVVKERAGYERADKAIASKRARTEFQPVPEASAIGNIWWYPIEGVQIQVGYDFMSFFNTIASPNPVSFSYGSPNPDWRNGVTRYIDGFHAGIAFIF